VELTDIHLECRLRWTQNLCIRQGYMWALSSKYNWPSAGCHYHQCRYYCFITSHEWCWIASICGILRKCALKMCLIIIIIIIKAGTLYSQKSGYSWRQKATFIQCLTT